MSPRLRVIIAFMSAATLASPAMASPLNLVLNTSGDITSGFTDVVYNAVTHQFRASGYALTLNDGHSNQDAINNGAFSILATVDNTGHATAGTISVTGTVGSYGPTLVTGNLSDFGFSFNSGGVFEFLFNVTGGSLLNTMYGGIGSQIGVILNANGLNPGASGFGASFYNNFGLDGFGSGFSDTGTTVVPVPASVGLAALGLGMINWLKRRVGA